MLKRILALTLALAALTGAYLAPQFLGQVQFPSLGKAPSGFLSTVKARDLTLVCPGSAFATGGASGTSVSSFVRSGSAVVDYSSTLPSGVTLRTRPLDGPAASQAQPADTAGQVASLNTVSSLAITVADPTGKAQQSSGLLTAQSFQGPIAGSLAGAVGTDCQNPEPVNWLVGGVTTVGREALLILANPSGSDATVNLKLWGEQGLIDGAGLNGISVSANRTVVLPLSGYAPDQKSLAVQVVSSGPSLAAWIQERTTRGTVAAGADLISPSTSAAKNLNIPGLLKRGTADAQTLIAGNADYQDLTPAIQVFVPGSKDANVTVQVIGSDSKTLGTVLQQSIPAGTITSLDITGIADGDYSVFVVADQPVMAAVKLSRTNTKATPNSDFAWLPAVAPMSTPVFLTAPAGGVSKLAIANGGNVSATVQVTEFAAGAKQAVTVAALGSRVLTLAPGTSFSVSSDEPVSATMISDFKGAITALPVIDYSNTGGRMSVTVR